MAGRCRRHKCQSGRSQVRSVGYNLGYLPSLMKIKRWKESGFISGGRENTFVTNYDQKLPREAGFSGLATSPKSNQKKGLDSLYIVLV